MKSLDKKKEYINKKDIIKYKIPVDKNFLKMFKDDDIFEITKMKSQYKKKTKELEWTEEYRKLLKEYQVNAEDWDCFPDLGVKFINDLLTQQRTELLEKIKDLQTYVLFNDTEKLISLEEVINIINKK